MSDPSEAPGAAAVEAAVQEPAPRSVPDFMWEIDQNGFLVLPADFFTNLKGKKTKCLPADWFVKTAMTRGFFDKTIVHPISKNRVLNCMSVSGNDVDKWRSFVLNEAFGRMFDSFMSVVCDAKMVAIANEAEMTMENGSKPKTFKEVAACFFTKKSKALATTTDGQARLSTKYFHVIESMFLQIAEDNFIKAGVIDYFAKRGMKALLG